MALVKEILNVRENLLKRFPSLKNDLDRVLDKTGKIIKIQTVAEINKRMSRMSQSNSEEELQ